MDVVDDINNEEAYVEDEPQIMHGPSHDGPPKQDNIYVEDSFLPSYLSNPWIWLAFAILAYYIYKRLGLNSRYTEWQQQREYAAEVAHIKKNPEFYRERMEAMERARQKQQDAHDIAARELAEREQKKEEERRAQKIEQLENLVSGKGYNNKSNRNGVATSDNKGTTSKANTTKSNFRSDYNPLMGGGGGESRYRPDRRGLSSGGGG